MGKYDIPAAIKYVLKTQPKGHSNKLYYIGHSMGTTMFWVAMNEHQHFMEKSIHMMVAMGPVAYVSNMESPIALLTPFLKEIEVYTLSSDINN
jgi:lysosomal acid lipase/cholesteryl ester hydrolase